MTRDQSALLDLLEELRTADDGSVMRRLLAHGLQELIEAEARMAIGAGRHERTSSRTTQRNGSRLKTISTTAGDVTVGIPKTRTGSFFPSLLEPRRRIDRALHAGVLPARSGLEASCRDDQSCKRDRRTVSRVQAGPSRLGDAAPIRYDTADAVQLLTKSGKCWSRSGVPEVQLTENVNRGRVRRPSLFGDEHACSAELAGPPKVAP